MNNFIWSRKNSSYDQKVSVLIIKPLYNMEKDGASLQKFSFHGQDFEWIMQHC